MKKLIGITFILALLIVAVTPVLAAKPGFGQLYYDGEVVRTVVPPAAAPQEGRDNLYVIPGQMAVAAVAPGDVRLPAWIPGLSARTESRRAFPIARATGFSTAAGASPGKRSGPPGYPHF